jgi:CheY-like chemotaxis protein
MLMEHQLATARRRSTFHTFPASAEDASRSGPQQGSAGTVLVVDDTGANRRLARELLEDAGYKVELASDSISMWEVLKTCQPDLILMDLQLPGMDGWELTRRLKINFATKHIPVVALTAYSVEGDRDRARAVGFDDFVAKPISTEELPSIVRRNLHRLR